MIWGKKFKCDELVTLRTTVIYNDIKGWDVNIVPTSRSSIGVDVTREKGETPNGY